MLASTDDYEALLGVTLTDPETARVTRLLEMASSSVLASTYGQTLVEATTTETLRQFNGVFWFPQRPVTAVASVEIGGFTIDPADYRWTRGGNGRGAKLIRRYTYNGISVDTSWSRNEPDLYRPLLDYERNAWFTRDTEATATYTHGFADGTVERDLIATAVVNMASTAMHAQPGQAVTSRSKTVASFALAETYAQPVTTSVGMIVPSDVQALIERLCCVEPAASIEVTA